MSRRRFVIALCASLMLVGALPPQSSTAQLPPPLTGSIHQFDISHRQIRSGQPGSPTTTKIALRVAGLGWTIEIVDIDGNPVRTFLGAAGSAQTIWDGNDLLGNPVPNGVYKVTLNVPSGDPLVPTRTESGWVTVGPGPVISGISGQPHIGRDITIFGSGFTRGAGVFGVTVGGEPADVVSWSDGQIVVTIPSDIGPSINQPGLAPGHREVIVTVADLDSVPKLFLIKSFQPFSSSLVPGRVRMLVTPGTDAASVAASHGATLLGRVFPDETDADLLRWYDLGVPAGSESNKIQSLSSDAGVEWAEGMADRSPDDVPNDPNYGMQWHFNQTNNIDIDAPEAWTLSKGSPSLSIAILDTGVGAHPDLAANALPQKTYTNGCPESIPSHGTAVAGAAAAATNNSLGVAGTGWQTKVRGYRLGFPKVENGETKCLISSEWVRALSDASRDGTDVVNMSFGDRLEYSKAEQQMINKAWDRGLVLVASAGNDSSTVKTYPGDYDHVITVGASDQDGSIRDTSNHGQWVEVFAPGSGIWTTNRDAAGFGYSQWSGTSFAAPLVAGSAALLLAHEPSSNTAVARALKRSPRAVPGGGPPMLSALNAIQALANVNLPSGLFVRRAGKTEVFFLNEGRKHKVRTAALHTWGIASAEGPQVARVFKEQIRNIPTGDPLGFRPGTLISATDSDAVFFVSNDAPNAGDDWTLPFKRSITTQVMACLGFTPDRVIEVAPGALGLHPNGPAVTDCARHPNGSIVQSGQEFEVLDNDRLRHATANVAASWGMSDDAVPPGALDLTLPAGSAMGFRPGRLIRFQGSPIFLITAAGDFARATKRNFADPGFTACYGFDQATAVQEVTQAESNLHNPGANLGC